MKRVLCLLCATVIAGLLLTACNVVDFFSNPKTIPQTTDNSGTQVTPVKNEGSFAAQAGSYWKMAGFDGIENANGDYWSDLFLWEDKTGCFRFSQATPASQYYGIHDVIPCDWSSGENGAITLFSPGTQIVLYTALVEGGVLTLQYDGYTNETIRMEQSNMPPFGSQWTVLDLHGTWQMTSYTDAASGTHTAAHLTKDNVNSYFASEITLDAVEGVLFWIADPSNNCAEIVGNMNIGYRDDTWHPVTQGAIWKGCVNEAWYVELTGNSDTHVGMEVTYADGKLLLKKTDANQPDRFPASFTAEYKYIGSRDDMGAGSDTETGTDTAIKRFAEAAFGTVLHRYRQMLQSEEDADIITERLVDYLQYDAQLEDEQQVIELRYSIEEPLRGNSRLGYGFRDINNDYIPELFILSEDDYTNDYTINAIYTLQGGSVVFVDAYWSRSRCALAADGLLHLSGSSGADDSFYASFSLNARTGKLQLVELFDDFDFPGFTTKEAGLVFTPFKNQVVNGASHTDGMQNEAKQISLFSTIVGYKGKVYSLYAAPEIPNFIGIQGSTQFTPLPEAIGRFLEDEEEYFYVYDFTIYEDHIYYLAAEAGSDVTSGAVYRCNMDGTLNTLLVYANNLSMCMLSDGWLYYSAETDGGDFVVSKVDLNETDIPYSSDFPKDSLPDVYTYQGCRYYFFDRTLYKQDVQTEATTPLVTVSEGPMSMYAEGMVVAVVNDTVYFVTAGEEYENCNTFLFGVNVNGGDSALLASWFTS